MAQIGAVTVVSAALLGLAPARVHACGKDLCDPSLYFPAQGTVPANLPGFYWWPSTDNTTFSDNDDAGAWEHDPSQLPKWLRMARIDGTSPEWLEVTLHAPDATGGPYLIVPNAPLLAGGEYVLWDVTGCHLDSPALDVPPTEAQRGLKTPEGWPDGIAHVTAAAAAPLPDMLGSLSASDPGIGQVPVSDDSGCVGPTEVLRVELSLIHGAAAQAWRDVFFYATEIDGAPYAPRGTYNYLSGSLDPTPGTSFAGRSRDLVYTECEPLSYGEGVEQGAHRARFGATIPGTDIVLQTNEVSFTLSCPELPDAGPTDAGSDAALGPMDAAVDASQPARPRADASRHDDGCTVAGPSGSALWPLLLALGWLVRRRRS